VVSEQIYTQETLAWSGDDDNYNNHRNNIVSYSDSEEHKL
jgi:hypothetical protein